MRKSALALSLLLCFAISLLHAQKAPIPTFITDSLENYINDAMVKWQIPGMAVGIVKDDSIIMQKGFGICKIGDDAKVDENTLFIIASNTKAFTGTLLAMLENEQKCSLEDKVVKWVPRFKMHDDWLTQHASLTDIVTHRLGFETFQGDFMFFYSGLTDDQMYEKFAKITPLYDFRTKYGYCNAGYFFAGKAIQSITGKPWDTVLYEKILNPLHMTRTTSSLDMFEQSSNISTAHSLVNYKLQTVANGRFNVLNPAASIASSVADMNKWTRTLLDSGMFEGKEVIPIKAIEQTRQPETIQENHGHPFNKSLFSLYGLGWSILDYNEYKIVMHGGAVNGFLSNVVLVPEIKLGIVILTNSDQNWLYSILKYEIIDAFMDLPYRNYSNLYYPYFEKRAQKDSIHLAQIKDTVSMKIKPPLPLKDVAGSYTSEVYGKLNIAFKKGDLTMSFENHPDLTAKLEYFNDNKFLCTYSSPSHGIELFPFVIENNKIKSFTLSVNSDLEFTTYEFVKD